MADVACEVGKFRARPGVAVGVGVAGSRATIDGPQASARRTAISSTLERRTEKKDEGIIASGWTRFVLRSGDGCDIDN